MNLLYPRLPLSARIIDIHQVTIVLGFVSCWETVASSMLGKHSAWDREVREWFFASAMWILGIEWVPLSHLNWFFVFVG